jgi:DNA-binding transcriptional MocR family regulator
VFQIVAVRYDAYAALPSPTHRWLLTCFSRYVDRAGKAFPSLRQLARDARMSLASVSRYMTALERLEVFQRQRRPGGRYVYQLAEAYRPRWPRRVPASEQGVSGVGTQEANPIKHEKRFANFWVTDSGLPDPADQWKARMRSWSTSRFWLPAWGAKPGEPGCMAPAALMT